MIDNLDSKFFCPCKFGLSVKVVELPPPPISKFLKTDYLSAKHMLNNNIMYPLKHHPRKLICKEVYVQHPSKGALMGSSRWIGINLAYICMLGTCIELFNLLQRLNLRLKIHYSESHKYMRAK